MARNSLLDADFSAAIQLRGDRLITTTRDARLDAETRALAVKAYADNSSRT